MTDNDMSELVNRAFADSPRPEHFTDYRHCSECAEHDDLLRSRNLETLAIEDINNGGWQPLCFLSPEGWRYYFSAFVRLTFANLQDSFLEQFLFFLPRAADEDFSLFNLDQRAAVRAFLYHVREQHMDLVEDERCESELQEAITAWEAAAC
jgi:hypothetical protein